MATAGGDATVRLWYPDGRLRTTFYAHNNGVLHLGFSRDGRTLASASEDKTAILWDLGRLLDPDRIVACACDRVRDYLKTNPEVPEERRNLCDSLRSSRVVRPQSV